MEPTNLEAAPIAARDAVAAYAKAVGYEDADLQPQIRELVWGLVQVCRANGIRWYHVADDVDRLDAARSDDDDDSIAYREKRAKRFAAAKKGVATRRANRAAQTLLGASHGGDSSSASDAGS